MDYRDASISDITIVVKPGYVSQMQRVIELLNSAGVGITSVNEDVGAVEGSVESHRVHDVQKLECVDAVRTTFSYIADYPAGDPRDLDGANRDNDDAV